ncbi:MAG TPA: DUF5979 domain-containing protein, partial [Acidimicrobiia bacterium]
MIAPLNGGVKVPALSHAFVCYSVATVAPLGSLTVTKSVVGDAGSSTFTVTVDCPGTTYDRTLTFGSSGALTGGGPLPITGIPDGTQCTVTETNAGGASGTTYAVNGGSASSSAPTVTIAGDTTTTVAITNTFAEVLVTGSLTVTKSVVGDAGSSTFTVAVDCPGDTFDRTLTFGSTGTLTGGGSLPITGIPAGTQCTVTETGNGGASSTTYAVNGGSASSSAPTVTIAGESTKTVKVTNTFDPGSLTVTKSVVGNAGSSTFTVAVDCPGTTFDRTLVFDATGTLTSGGPLPITGIPNSTVCTVTETNAGGASSTTYAVNGGSASASAPTVTIVSDQTQSVAITNNFVTITFIPPPPTIVSGRVVFAVPPAVEVAGTSAVQVAGALAFTGSPFTAGFTLAGGGLMIVGALMLAVGRRRKRAQI